MTVAWVSLKQGPYGTAWRMAEVKDRPATEVCWLLSMAWLDLGQPTQYLLQIPPGATADRQLMVHKLDLAGRTSPYFPRDVAAGQTKSYAPPAISIDITATKAQANRLAHLVACACVDGLMHPGEPEARDWQNRLMWNGSILRTLEHIKEGHHHDEL